MLVIGIEVGVLDVFMHRHIMFITSIKIFLFVTSFYRPCLFLGVNLPLFEGNYDKILAGFVGWMFHKRIGDFLRCYIPIGCTVN